MTNSIIIYSVIIFLLNILILINLSPISKFINLYDIPDKKRKIHKFPTPLIGGLIIFFNISIFIIFFSIFNIDYIFESLFILEIKPLVYFLIALILIFFIGIYDDKYSMPPLSRLILISIIFFLYLKTDNTSLLTKIDFSFSENKILLNYGSSFFTYLCLIVLLISSNMFDGINLQSFVFYFLNFVFLYFIYPNIFALTCCFSLIIFGFLNSRGKIFLGDSGVYILSTILSILYIKYYNFNIDSISADAVFSFLFFPVLDACRCILMRVLKGKNPFYGDQSHFHHILLRKFSYFNSLLIIIIFLLVPFIFYFLNITSLVSIFVTLILYLTLFFRFRKK